MRLPDATCSSHRAARKREGSQAGGKVFFFAPPVGPCAARLLASAPLGIAGGVVLGWWGCNKGGCVGLLALCVPSACAGQTPTRVVGAFAAPLPCSVRPRCLAAPKGGAVSEAFSSSRLPCPLPPSRYCAANPAALSEEFPLDRLFSPQYLYEL